MKSQMMKWYLQSPRSKALGGLTAEQMELCDSIYKLAEDRYETGYDILIECFEPGELIAQFKTIEEAIAYVELRYSVKRDIQGLAF